jgi:acyl-CoA thioesterase
VKIASAAAAKGGDIGRYMAGDRLGETLGIELLDVGPGRATTRMQVEQRHLNGLGILHGGSIFSLADIAFAAASNAHGNVAVAISVTIEFLKAVRSGTLTATATEVSDGARIRAYAVRVEDEAGGLVALFQGLVYRKSETIGAVLEERRQVSDKAKGAS